MGRDNWKKKMSEEVYPGRSFCLIAQRCSADSCAKPAADICLKMEKLGAAAPISKSEDSVS